MVLVHARVSRRIVGLLIVALIMATASCTSSPPSPASGTSRAQNPGYVAARVQWLKSPQYIGTAGQAIPLLKAVGDLDHATQIGGDRATYSEAVAYLEEIVHSSDTNPTPAQTREFQQASKWLDRFFDTPGLFNG